MILVLEEEAGMWEISFLWGKVVTRFPLGVSEHDCFGIFQALGYTCIAKCIPFLMLYLLAPLFPQIL